MSAEGETGLSSVLLPSVVHEQSTAVLIVDLDRRAVTYANDLAREFVPDRPFPIPVDEWSDLAGLEDVAGAGLPGGPTPAHEQGRPAESLLRIAGGEPVTGEAVTAARATSATKARETLWVLGLPLSGAPEPIERLALVVFLPARNAALVADVVESAVSIRDRAVLATRVSFTITDPTKPDNPLVWVNPAFTSTSGYTFEDAVGHNCRFLQGPDTDRDVVAEIRASLAKARPVTTTLLNYRKDGTTFWNELSISPVRDAAGELTHFVGVQTDVTSRVEAQQSRDAALSQVAEVADRLALLADVTARLAGGRQPEQIVQMLSELLVPRIGSMCIVLQLDETGRPANPFIAHDRGGDPDVDDAVRRLHTAIIEDTVEGGPIRQVLQGDTRHLVLADYPRPSDEPVEGLRTLLGDDLRMRSMLAAPLRSRHAILGVVVIMSDDSRPALGDEELALVRDIAMRAGLMLENTRLYAQEQATTATLQRSLLPAVPEIEGLEIAASYVPSANEAAVGGDWYDVFPLRDRGGDASVGVVVGDVMGHNYDSAARMGKLSTIVRSYGWPGSEPFTVLTAVDELLAGSDLDYMATCLYGTITLHGSGATLRYSSAGHPPAIVRGPDGEAQVLNEGRGPMIGVSHMLPTGAIRPEDAVLDLAPGSTLICFTDGLTDGFADEPDLDDGLAEVTRLTERLPVDASPAQIVESLTGASLRHDDDVAVIAIRVR